jgi:hypothetical protein
MGLKYLISVSLIICLMSTLMFSQTEPDSTEPKIPQRVDFAIAEAISINLLIWSYDRYLREDNYSFMISWRSVERNLRHGFEWDPNNFSTNFLAHPFHGNTYFNAGRTNGLNFWESAPLAMGGSMMWEVFMESEFPSYNDWIMTTFAGIALGESLFRFSEQVLDDRARGGERIWREVAGTLLNPVGGFNRLVRGDMFRHKSTVNHIRNPFRGYLALGGRGDVKGTDFGETKFAPALEFTVHYGETFTEKSKLKPFDFFHFRYWTSKRDTVRNTILMAQGVLFAKQYQKGNQNHVLAVMQNYDYLNTTVFNIGSMAFTGALLSRFPLGKEFRLETGPALGVILLGAGNNEYVTSYQGLNYNYGQGFKAKIDLLLIHPKYGGLLLDYSYFGIYARRGVAGVDRLHVFDATYLIRIWRNVGVGLEYFYYYRNAKYDIEEDVKKDVRGLRGLISLSF